MDFWKGAMLVEQIELVTCTNFRLLSLLTVVGPEDLTAFELRKRSMHQTWPESYKTMFGKHQFKV